MDQVITRHVTRAVEMTGGNVLQAARALGLSRNKVYKHLRQSDSDAAVS